MTGAIKCMGAILRNSLLVLVLALPLAAAPEFREAPNGGAAAVNQLSFSGNACGPAALLTAFRSGNTAWRRASDGVAGKNDREQVLGIIREYGMRPSKHVPGRPRWSRNGVGVSDLRDIGNELAAGKYLPQLSEEVFFLKGRETPEKLLKRVHHRLETSLEKGLPPVLSLRRYALRKTKGGDKQWVVLDAHFVTLVRMPRKLGRGGRSFAVSYIDPWGAKRADGRISIPEPALFTDSSGRAACLVADFPKADVGLKKLRRGEKSVLTLAAAIGRW